MLGHSRGSLTLQRAHPSCHDRFECTLQSISELYRPFLDYDHQDTSVDIPRPLIDIASLDADRLERSFGSMHHMEERLRRRYQRGCALLSVRSSGYTALTEVRH